MSSADRIDASQQAVLQLVLKQGKGYGEIADLLGLDADAVRNRAHAALEALGPDAPGLTGQRRAEIADYLLGQQSVSQREATRAHLGRSAAGRAWARAVSGELRALGGDDLPEIPDADPDLVEEEDTDAGEPLRDEGTGRSSRLGGILLLIGIAAVVAVVVILIVSGSGDDSGTTSSTTNASSPTTTQQQQQQTSTGAQPTPIAQINLRAADGSKAVGVAQVLAQGKQRALAIVAQRLKPGTKTSAYAVWLYTTPKNAKLLGFVDPPVGKSGRFANFNALPAGASKYKELIVTREKSQSNQPGTIVLRGPLKLS
jgi:hypothetical protein